MKHYEIIRIKEKYIVIAISYVNPMDEIDYIANDLKEKGCCGKIIFDLLLCNGLNSNRYLELYFDGNVFDIFSAKKIKIENEMVVKELNMYMIQRGYLDKGILQHAQIYALKRNC
mgnify:CR=1 FL=1